MQQIKFLVRLFILNKQGDSFVTPHVPNFDPRKKLKKSKTHVYGECSQEFLLSLERVSTFSK